MNLISAFFSVSMTSESGAQFEGPEKLLEIWFAASPTELDDGEAKTGLRKVERAVWEDMLAIVQCKVLSVIEGTDIDAYLLSESSLFISPHRLILKTCGTTLNLYGLPRILEIARDLADLPSVYQCFYSRKAFMFPERQLGPHRDWRAEIEYLDAIFKIGAAYTVGKVNGDHWLLYMTSPACPENLPSPSLSISPPTASGPDYTIEILMTHLDPSSSQHFYNSDESDAHKLSSCLGITELFPPHLTTLDAYSFSPCGYSSNAIIKSETDNGDGYYTIHVTPEEGWSYASFECNVPLPPSSDNTPTDTIPDLKTLIRRVVSIFQPSKLSLTLFISSEHNINTEDDQGESAIEAAQRAFRSALSTGRGYTRTDKINYEFGAYDLAFASFELTS